MIVCLTELQIIMNAFNGPQISETIDDLSLQLEKWTRTTTNLHPFAPEIVALLNNAFDIITKQNIISKSAKRCCNDDIDNKKDNDIVVSIEPKQILEIDKKIVVITDRKLERALVKVETPIRNKRVKY